MTSAKSNDIISGWSDLPDSSLRAWKASPAKPDDSTPGVILFIEAFGVNDYFKRLAERYASAGYVALVPDIYHGNVYDYGNVEGAIGELQRLDERQAMDEASAAIDFFHSLGCKRKPTIIGYCMGGRLAFLSSIQLGRRLSGVVAYYGGSIAPEGNKDRFGRTGWIHRAKDVAAPILFHYGEADQSISPEEHARVAQALGREGKRYVLSVYPQCGHGFACDARESYNEAATEEAWALTESCIRRWDAETAVQES